MNLQKIKILSFFLMAAWLPVSNALSSDPDQPMNIEADSAELDDERGVTEYSGAVVMTQGSIRIRAETVTVYDGDDGVEKVILVGKPARFRQRPDGKKNYIRASADRIEYLMSQDLLLLKEKAQVTQGNDLFSGNFIRYDTKKNQVKAKKAKNGSGRVKITIAPKNKK